VAVKKNKAIKQLKKQVKKLNARIDDMSREIKDLQNTADTFATDQMATELGEESAQRAWPDPKFSEDEVEIAEEMAEDAGEVEDILEKKGR